MAMTSRRPVTTNLVGVVISRESSAQINKVSSGPPHIHIHPKNKRTNQEKYKIRKTYEENKK